MTYQDVDKALLVKENSVKLNVFLLYFPSDNPIIKVLKDY